MKNKKLLSLFTLILSLNLSSCNTIISSSLSSQNSSTNLSSNLSSSSLSNSSSTSSTSTSFSSSKEDVNKTTVENVFNLLIKGQESLTYSLKFVVNNVIDTSIYTPKYISYPNYGEGLVLDKSSINDTEKLVYNYKIKNGKVELGLPYYASYSYLDSLDSLNPLSSVNLTFEKESLVLEDGYVVSTDYKACSIFGQLVGEKDYYYISKVRYKIVENDALEVSLIKEDGYSIVELAPFYIENISTSKDEKYDSQLTTSILPTQDMDSSLLNDFASTTSTMLTNEYLIEKETASKEKVTSYKLSRKKDEEFSILTTIYKNNKAQLSYLTNAFNKDSQAFTRVLLANNTIYEKDLGYSWNSYYYKAATYFSKENLKGFKKIDDSTYKYYGTSYSDLLYTCSYIFPDETSFGSFESVSLKIENNKKQLIFDFSDVIEQNTNRVFNYQYVVELIETEEVIYPKTASKTTSEKLINATKELDGTKPYSISNVNDDSFPDKGKLTYYLFPEKKAILVKKITKSLDENNKEVEITEIYGYKEFTDSDKTYMTPFTLTSDKKLKVSGEDISSTYSNYVFSLSPDFLVENDSYYSVNKDFNIYNIDSAFLKGPEGIYQQIDQSSIKLNHDEKGIINSISYKLGDYLETMYITYGNTSFPSDITSIDLDQEIQLY